VDNSHLYFWILPKDIGTQQYLSWENFKSLCEFLQFLNFIKIYQQYQKTLLDLCNITNCTIETHFFIIIKLNYFQNAQKRECFLDDFEALVREIDIRGWLLRSQNVILKIVNSKIVFFFNFRYVL
jgi:hypothetical protein